MKKLIEALLLLAFVILMTPVYWLGFAWSSTVLFFKFGSLDAYAYLEGVAKKKVEK